MKKKPIVFFASDKNKFYSDFAPYVTSAWESFGYEVKYTLVDDDNCFVDPQIIPYGNQAQICRVLLPALYPDRICLTSDIDMLPLSKDYFTSAADKVEKQDKSTLFSLTSDAYQPRGENYKRHPICYLLGYGETFSNITKINKQEEVGETMLEWWNEKYGWDTDEICFSKRLYSAIRSETVFLHEMERGWNNGIANLRIDRSSWSYDIKRLYNNEYIDSHMLRPLEKYRKDLKPLFFSIT